VGRENNGKRKVGRRKEGSEEAVEGGWGRIGKLFLEEVESAGLRGRQPMRISRLTILLQGYVINAL